MECEESFGRRPLVSDVAIALSSGEPSDAYREFNTSSDVRAYISRRRFTLVRPRIVSSFYVPLGRSLSRFDAGSCRRRDLGSNRDMFVLNSRDGKRRTGPWNAAAIINFSSLFVLAPFPICHSACNIGALSHF